jgi:hypothetical protein
MNGALEYAHLVLLGQIALIASAIAFGVPYFYSLPSHSGIRFTDVAVFYLVFVLSSCVMFIVNLIIGWTAVRDSARNPDDLYDNRLFILDILIVVVFFMMNNVIMFSFGDTLSLLNVSTIKHVISEPLSLHTVAYTAAALYLLTAVFLLLCKGWNKIAYIQAGVEGSETYELLLWLIIGIDLIACLMAVVEQDHLGSQIMFFIYWLGGWVYINSHWLAMDFFGEARRRKAPSS